MRTIGRIGTFAFVIALALGCTGRRGGRPRGDAGPAQDSGWTFMDAAQDSPLPDGAVPDTGPDAGPPVRGCYEQCVAASDCASDPPLFDVDNWLCTGGICSYAGCNGDTECAEGFADPDYVCRAGEGGQRGCYRSCAGATDCVSDAPLFDVDNWTCTSGVCSYLGCNGDAECAEGFADPSYVCRPGDGGQRGCFRSCGAAADCASESALFDVDNWSCAGGLCMHTGCNGDPECAAAFDDPAWVCRAP